MTTTPLTALEKKYIAARRAGKILDPVPGYPVSTKYGVTGPEWGIGHHTGEDHACPTGTPLVAVTWGHVIGVGWSPNGIGQDYGNAVIIEQASGTHMYFYAHMLRFNVHLGEAVKPGQVIGWSDNTGHSTGPHCHFEVRPVGGLYGSDVNPLYVKQTGHAPGSIK